VRRMKKPVVYSYRPSDLVVQKYLEGTLFPLRYVRTVLHIHSLIGQ
jgi:hypothetical protein